MIYYFTSCCDESISFGIQNNANNAPDNWIWFVPNNFSISYYLSVGSFLGCVTYSGSSQSILPNSTLYNLTPIVTDYQSDCSKCILFHPCITPPPVVTPIIAGQLNECDVITIMPMEIECVSNNPTTYFSSDGEVSVSITGGTPPYKVYWSSSTNPSIGIQPALYNLLNGTYAATVVDFYGDFTATTYCTINTDKDCIFSASIVEFFLPSPTPTNTPTLTPTPTFTPTPTMTKTPTPTPTPSTPSIEIFTMNAIGVNQIDGGGAASGFIINSTNNFQIDWGDGNITSYSSGVGIGASHTYSSPYTGPINILSTDLTTITFFNAQSQPHLSQSFWVSTTELSKLDGLLNLQTITNGLFVTGDVVNLPNTLTGLTIYNTNVSGDTSNLPPGLTSCIITGANTISGNTSGLPNNIMTTLVIQGGNTISGDVLDLPRTTYQCQIYGNNTISGDTSGLPEPSFMLDIQGDNTISGNVSNIYPSQVVWIYGDNTVSGDTSGFASPIQNLSIKGNNTISGDVSNLPSSLTTLDIQGDTSITGNISGFPPNLINITLPTSNFVSVFGDISTLPSTLTQMFLKSSGTLTGDLFNLPSPVRRIEITSQMTFTYTSGRVWANNFLALSLSPTNVWAGFNQSETDNLLINTQPKYINNPGASSFLIKCSGTPKRTSASDTAYNALVALIGPTNVTLG